MDAGLDGTRQPPRLSFSLSQRLQFLSEKNTNLKGRRRYQADLTDMEEECATGLVAENGYGIKTLQAGDEEGTIDLVICDAEGQRVFGLNLLISDTSDYPKNHVFFSSTPDYNLPPRLLEIVESVVSDTSRPIAHTVHRLLIMLAKSDQGTTARQSSSQELEMDDDDNSMAGDYEAFDQFDEFDQGTANGSKLNLQDLQNDFVETVAAGYRPGMIHFAEDEFAISISLPVITLAKSIPPRALMAWDRRLLTRSQHLTLLISGFRGVYPPLNSGGAYNALAQRCGSSLAFKLGLTPKYKPGKEYAKDAGRTFGLIISDAEDELLLQADRAANSDDLGYDYEAEYVTDAAPVPALIGGDAEDDEGSFDRFSLSGSLEALLDHALLKIIQLRRKFGLGWAGAELLLSEMEKTQKREDAIFDTQRERILAADHEESVLARTNDLPPDPLFGLEKNGQINLTLTAFCYLIRRLSLCPRYCIVCHNKLDTDFEALKPYVCDSKLCAYQYHSLNRGPSLEYEIIHNPKTVDLLLSIAHTAATEQVLDEPFPTGLGLRVPPPDASKIRELARSNPSVTGELASAMPLLRLEHLTSVPMMRASIAQMIDSLPAVDDMKKHLERKVKAGKAKPKLKDTDPTILPAAWSILRWCVASCTAYLEEITSGEERIKNLDPAWRQFRFSVGSPDAEAKFKGAVVEAQQHNVNAIVYPSLYAFHGSPLRNWHSIIRHGLWYKTITHGRAYGNGVYLAKEGSVSMGTYAQTGRSTWRKSKICPTNCVALAEIVNFPNKFVSQNPHFVIEDTHWIICRYLLVKGPTEPSHDTSATSGPVKKVAQAANPLVKLDPAHPVTLNGKRIEIPEPSHQINSLLKARQEEYCEEDNDAEDMNVFDFRSIAADIIENSEAEEDDTDVDMDVHDDDGGCGVPKSVAPEGKGNAAKKPGDDDWKHDPEWVRKSVENLMPPPLEASPSATMAVQRELRAMLKEQETAKSLKELGWYMPPNLIGDNLFQWIVEMHSFDENLQIARDLKAKKLNSIIFEIRFPPTFPIAPPFFRIISPRFLPFIQGGGGHVTGGGSICMDLLTSDGWLPSYSMAAVLIQIKLAICNVEPRPARLSPDFDRPYGVQEALDGYKRAAAAHGWQVPVGIERLVRY
ncbi:putative ubiquitin-conjugating enzyme family protein [Lyophyllum shimeji]|uniref:Ubiquitin-conjugating enzyme family protein n=1 Tax=Lyophyllum shimeji TaxID=47721 RepID=A0A9P3PI03_LYOSH|nr:putative ubiquitin-conjugating enzyme family protein [Lyophyllum shimeji]